MTEKRDHKDHKAAEYTRGWEHLKHQLLMFKASVLTHIVVSILVGVCLGSIWFYAIQPESSKGNFVQYVKANIYAKFSEKKTAEYDLGNGPKKIASGYAKRQIMEKYFQNRSLWFLCKQLIFRLVICIGVISIALLLWVTSYGAKIRRSKHRRGAELLKLDEYLVGKKRERLIAAYAIAMVLGLLFFGLLIGSEGRKFFSDYVFSAIYLKSDTIASIASPSGGTELAWYNQPEPGFRKSKEVYEWIRSSVYGGHSVAIVVTGGLLLLLVMGALGHLVCLYLFKWKEGKDQSRIRLTGMTLKPGEEVQSFVFIGSPGSGKSTTMFDMLDQVRKRKERAIVYDPKGEFIEKYYRHGRDFILNPLDKRYQPWTPWADISEDAHYTQIAKSLYPTPDDESKKFWSENASLVFEETLRKMAKSGNTTNKEIWKVVSTFLIKDMFKLVKGTSAQSSVDPGAEQQSAGVLSTFKSKLTSWRFLPDAEDGKKPFSIRDYVRDESADNWIFLSLRQEQRDALRPLISLWYEIAISTILTMPVDLNRRIWCFVDELSSLQRMPSLKDLLERGRGHGACTVLGIQSVAQLRDIYGRDGTEAILSMPQTWLVLKSVEPATAAWLAKALLEKEVDEIRKSSSMGADTMRDGVSYSENARMISLVMPTEIMGLKGPTEKEAGEGYLKTARIANKVFSVKIEYKKRKNIAAAYEPTY